MSRSGIRIAIVDDDPYVCRALTRLLRASGYTVDAYVSAQEFVDSLTRGTPQCLIVDFRMPTMTGLDLCRHLARSGAQIPTILITAHGDEETFRQAESLGTRVCLEKPLQEASLLAAIETATAHPAGGDC
jgi:FixJ family two-component response regulator